MKKRLFSIDLSTGSYDSFVDRIVEMAAGRKSSYVCVANVHMCVEAHKHPEFAAVVNGADIITPDGMPLVKGLKYMYGIDQERMAGMDLLPDLLKSAEAQQLRVFFYGGTEDMMQRTQSYVKARYANLSAMYYSPPFRALSRSETNDVVDIINSSGAHLVVVALGCPKQEKWMADMKGRIQACMIGIGGALPVMIGIQKRAPLWMQRGGLEWLYRLMQEPRRLFKRYFITNSIFVGLVLKAKLAAAYPHRMPETAEVLEAQ